VVGGASRTVSRVTQAQQYTRRKIRPAQDPGRHALALSEAWVDATAVAEDGDNLPQDLVLADERIVLRQGIAASDQMLLAMAYDPVSH
jgi:hypothetical protein